MTIVCPIDCVKSGCPSDPDFLEKHSTFLLTLTGAVSTLIGVIFTYFLKSRCTTVSCCCASCNREPLEVTADEAQIEHQL